MIKKDKQREEKRAEAAKRATKLKVTPLGGLQEIGKNITVLEYGRDIILIDCGLKFPDDEMLGIDIVIPDFTYLKQNAKKIRGLIITHGHEDHIGAIPYLLRELNVPIYGTKLPIGLIKNKLDEHGIKGKLHNINAGDKIKLGVFKVEAIRTTHSIADAICLSIDTPVGKIFHTGDFKIDFTPVDGEPINLSKFAQIGAEGVLLLMSDSTNATREGTTKSERVVGETLETIFRGSNSRIIVSTFSSNVHRIQKIVDNAIKYKRKIAFSGRSMLNVVSLAIELGYLKIPSTAMIDINKTRRIPDKELVIITTGSQGEPMSALARMANSEHRAIQIKRGDMVILSSTPVPGNEKMVSNVVNKLIEKGADVIYSDITDIHVSGHACADELKLVQSLIKPKYFMPVHGEFRHLTAHAAIAESMGMDKENIFILENGDSLELSKTAAKHKKDITQAEGIMVDGLGVGDVGNIVLRDRKLLSEAGLIIVVATVDTVSKTLVAGPYIISRGFVYVRENEDLIAEATEISRKSIEMALGGKKHKEKEWSFIKNKVKEELRVFIYQKTKRRPMILPIFMEV